MKRLLLVNTVIVSIMLAGPTYAFATETFRVNKAHVRTPQFVDGEFGTLISHLVDEKINSNLNEDDPADGYFDASFLLQFNNDNITYMQGLCKYTEKRPITCTEDLEHSYVNTTSAKVFVPGGDRFDMITSPTKWSISLWGIQFELDEARILVDIYKKPTDKSKGVYLGSVTGFISQAAAESTSIPSWVPFVGGSSYADVFDGQELKTNSEEVPGWWLVLDFESEQVVFVER